MKFFTLLLLSLLFLTSCNTDKTNSKKEDIYGAYNSKIYQLFRKNFKNKAKRITTSKAKAEYKFGEIVGGDLEYKFTEIFDDNFKKKYIEYHNCKIQNEKSIYDNNVSRKQDIYEKGEYIYDEQGDIVEEVIYANNGNLRKRVKVEYNLDKRYTKTSIYSPEEELLSVYKTFYNNERQVKEKHYYNSDGKLILLEVFYYKNGKEVQSSTSYDEHKNMIKMEFYSYEYDYNGNWTKKIAYRKERREPEDALTIIVRDIEYVQ